MDVRVVVFDEERDSWIWPPENAMEFMAWFEEKLASVPDEFKHRVTIEIGSVGGYEGDRSPSICIEYYRPMTEAETLAREVKASAQIAAQVTAELRTLAALKAKYGA